MCKSKKKRTGRKSKETKIPQGALIIKDDKDYYKMTPVFKFSSVDPNRWTLAKWKSDEIKDLIKTFQLMEKISWYEIRQHHGLRLKKIEHISKPSYISPDETIYELRVCKVKRIFGFINKNIFNIIWFDRDHSVCPEGKNTKHG